MANVHKKTKRCLTFWEEKSQADKFAVACAEAGITQTDAIRGYIEEFIKENEMKQKGKNNED